MLTLPRMVSLSALDQRRGVLELADEDWHAWLQQHDQPPLRRRQVQHWLLAKGATSFADMSDLPKNLRQLLEKDFRLFTTSVARHQESTDDTHKLLVQLRDQRLIECVLIQEQGRRTACVSTQVGCAMGCVFCASGLQGLERNLTTAEILEQLIRLRNLPPHGKSRVGEAVHRLTHIVVMGMGEPLANLDNLLAALEIATAKDGLGIGARHVTISTVGLPAKIKQLADLGKQYHLAVSLHAPNDPLRSQIVPTNAQIGLVEIMEAADYFFAQTGRQVTFEYVLLCDINDAPVHARELGRLLHRRHAHVNLIPFNDVDGLPYRRPTAEAVTTFTTTLRRFGVSVKVRKRKGADIDAACGQLRRQALASGVGSPD